MALSEIGFFDVPHLFPPVHRRSRQAVGSQVLPGVDGLQVGTHLLGPGNDDLGVAHFLVQFRYLPYPQLTPYLNKGERFTIALGSTPRLGDVIVRKMRVSSIIRRASV